MKILLIGASGTIGSRILSEASLREHDVTAVARNSGKIESSGSVTAVSQDVHDVSAMAELAADADVIVSALSPRNSGDAIRDAADFTRALIEVSSRADKRLLMVGGGSSLQMPDGTSALAGTPESVMPEAVGMRRAYAMMIDADIDFTVLAPGGMFVDGARTESFRLSDRTMLTASDGGRGAISAEDYAVALLDEIESPRHFRTNFNVAY